MGDRRGRFRGGFIVVSTRSICAVLVIEFDRVAAGVVFQAQAFRTEVEAYLDLDFI
jgi:hypothetical protein